MLIRPSPHRKAADNSGSAGTGKYFYQILMQKILIMLWWAVEAEEGELVYQDTDEKSSSEDRCPILRSCCQR